MAGEPAVSVERLTKHYGSHRGVEEISFTVDRGEILGFLGPNGSGKTTVIRTLMGLIRPSSGDARILGRPVNGSPAVREQVGYVPGRLELLTRMTVREYLVHVAALRRLDLTSSIVELADRFDLDLNASIASLSKGNKQKVGVVQAVMHRPTVLILDEPTSGLDPIVQKQFEALITDMRNRGTALLLSSHVMAEVEVVADRVAILDSGRLRLLESMSDLRSRIERSLEFEFSTPIDVSALSAVEGVTSIRAADRRVSCTIVGSERPLLAAVVQLDVVAVTSHEPSLEDVFMAVTRGGSSA